MTSGTAVRANEQLTIVVLHNGVPRSLEAPETASVQSLLSRALAEFGIAGQPDHALFTEQNVEVSVGQSLKDAGIVDEQRLVLRSRVVRAGTSRAVRT